MSCYHPLKGFPIGINPSGKTKYKICSYDTEYVIKNRLGEYVSVKEPCLNDKLSPIIRDYIDIPCGHCIGCYLDRSKQWADRCMLEANYHDSNCFITFSIGIQHISP